MVQPYPLNVGCYNLWLANTLSVLLPRFVSGGTKIRAGLFRIVISASRGADFLRIPRESTLFARTCERTSLGVGPYQDAAKASAPQAPWDVPGCVAPQGM